MQTELKAISRSNSLGSKDLKAAEVEAGYDDKHSEHGDLEKPAAAVEGGGDYSGAAKKSDPAEIALVRKLDRMIMVSPRHHILRSGRHLPKTWKADSILSRFFGPCISSTTSTETPSRRPD